MAQRIEMRSRSSFHIVSICSLSCVFFFLVMSSLILFLEVQAERYNYETSFTSPSTTVSTTSTSTTTTTTTLMDENTVPTDITISSSIIEKQQQQQQQEQQNPCIRTFHQDLFIMLDGEGLQQTEENENVVLQFKDKVVEERRTQWMDTENDIFVSPTNHRVQVIHSTTSNSLSKMENYVDSDKNDENDCQSSIDTLVPILEYPIRCRGGGGGGGGGESLEKDVEDEDQEEKAGGSSPSSLDDDDDDDDDDIDDENRNAKKEGDNNEIHQDKLTSGIIQDQTKKNRSDDDNDDDDVGVHTPEIAKIHNHNSSLKKRIKSTPTNRRRERFIDRIAAASSNLLSREHEARLDWYGQTKRKKSQLQHQEEQNNDNDDANELEEEEEGQDPNAVTPQSDLRRPGRYIHIVTTAALPWMTGTAVNPLLRAAYLHEELDAINQNANTTLEKNNNNDNDSPTSWVTLVIPWLELPEDQEALYHGHIFTSTQEQEEYVRDWLRHQANMPRAAERLNIVFYNARYHSGLGSIFAMGDIIESLPEHQLDVCVLEEPEHMNWYRAPGEGWTKRYNYVLGIIHTNYDQYATQHYSGLWTAPAIRLLSSAMVRAYCHKVIKLSDVLQPFAPEREVTHNVHGVRKEFIQSPNEILQWNSSISTSITNANSLKASSSLPNNDSNSCVDEREGQIYFIGKLLWAKGLNLLLEYEDYYKQMTGSYFPIHIYGSGPDQDDIRKAYWGRWVTDSMSHEEGEDDDDDKDTAHLNTTTSEEEQSITTDKNNGSALRHKNAFIRLFTWVNKRSKRQRSQEANSMNDLMEDVYKDLMELMEDIPSKAKQSVSKVKDLYEDKKVTKESMGKVSKKLRKTAKKLKKDISKVKGASIPMSFYELRRRPIPASFPGRIDHASLKNTHKIFVNPSLSEVLATTTYEALAMGKFAILPVHPSNAFFKRFPNALMYSSPLEFIANLQWALTHDPTPLSEEMARQFTWEAATDRLIDAAAITFEEANGREHLGRTRMDERIEWFHNELGKGAKGDILRKVLGGGPISNQVKYTQQKLSRDDNNEFMIANDEDADYVDSENSDVMDDSDDIGEDEEEDGFTKKFSNSALVKAIREAATASISVSS